MHKWHNFRFRMQWSENEAPKWWLDLFIVDRLFREVIANNGEKIRLWRFHRRAARDDSGHQLTLSLYIDHNDLVLIKNAILESDCFKILNTNKLLKEYLHEAGKPSIEDISDQSWPTEIKKSWPYFIAGVSTMLMEMIDLISKDVSESLNIHPPFKDLKDIEKYYLKVEERLTLLWLQKGSHAYFHHINALFGYAPLLAQPRNLEGILATF